MIDATETLKLALVANDASGWKMASRLWSLSLDQERRMSLATAALLACNSADTRYICERALGGAGVPNAAFLSDMDEASFWADMASLDELKAYSVACYLRLPERDRIAFQEWAGGRVAA